jgi:hypothetical protein
MISREAIDDDASVQYCMDLRLDGNLLVMLNLKRSFKLYIANVSSGE